MAIMHAVVGVLDALGQRIDKALRSRVGDYPPIWLQTGDGVKATARADGSNRTIVKIEADVLTMPGGGAGSTCGATLTCDGGERIVTLYRNTTGAVRTISALKMLPLGNVAANGSAYYKLEVRLLSDLGTVLGSDETSVTPWALAERAFPLSGPITVPAGDYLLASLSAHGSPTPSALDVWIGGTVA